VTTWLSGTKVERSLEAEMHKNPTENAVHKRGLSVPLYTRKHPLKFANIKFNSSQQVIQMYNQFQSV